MNGYTQTYPQLLWKTFYRKKCKKVHEKGLIHTLTTLIIRNLKAPVAQLDRVPGYEPGGRAFESLRARHTIQRLSIYLLGLFYFPDIQCRTFAGLPDTNKVTTWLATR